MKTVIRVGLFGLWILFVSLCLTYWLINDSSGIIPNPPEEFWTWILDALDAHNRKADVVILAGFIASVPVAFAVTLLFWFLWRRVRAK